MCLCVHVCKCVCVFVYVVFVSVCLLMSCDIWKMGVFVIQVVSLISNIFWKHIWTWEDINLLGNRWGLAAGKASNHRKSVSINFVPSMEKVDVNRDPKLRCHEKDIKCGCWGYIKTFRTDCGPGAVSFLTNSSQIIQPVQQGKWMLNVDDNGGYG